MPAPDEYFFSDDALEDASQAIITLLDAGASNAKVFVRDDSDALLAEIPLDDPSGVVASGGQITIDIDGPDTSANASGTVAYVEFADSDDNVHLTLPAVQGTSGVSGFAVFTTLTTVATFPVTMISATIG
jgi:hypothetical protein